MKKLIALLLVLMLALPACAEPAADFLAPFVLDVPEGVTVQYGAGGASLTYVHENGTTRAVAMVISRVPDPEADHVAGLAALMAQLAPGAQEMVPMTGLTPGFWGLRAVAPDALEGVNGLAVDQVTVMVLWQTALQAELLILTSYDVGGDFAQAELLLDMLLQSATVNGAPVGELPILSETQPDG